MTVLKKMYVFFFRFTREYHLVEKSGIFDSEWYLKVNDDLSVFKIDPLVHYLKFGAREGRDPHPLFSTSSYLEDNADVALAGVNPLVHYLKFGAKEGRRPNRFFEPSWYKTTYSDVASAGINPLVHFVTEGRNKGYIAGTSSLYDTCDTCLRKIIEDRKRVKKQRRVVVYTAITGNYEDLLLPSFIDDECDYVCFSDRLREGFGLWDVRKINYHNSDPTRMARYIKTHPHHFFPEYDFAIWLDSNVFVRKTLAPFVEKLEQDKTLAGFIPHPVRSCICTEAVACKLHNKDEKSKIDAQLERYKREKCWKDADLIESNFFVIRHNEPQIKAFLDCWWHEIDTGSKRDQLSLPVVLARNNINFSFLMQRPMSTSSHTHFALLPHTIRLIWD